MIPRIIHFVWFGEELPGWAEDIIGECRVLHPAPDWTVEVHRRFPADTPPGLWARARRCHQLCQLADLLYVWLLHARGGFVCDTDSVAVRSFEPLRELEAFTSHHHDRDRRLTNGFMGAEPGSRAFARVLHSILEDGPPTVGQIGTVRRTAYGPELLTRLFTASASEMTIVPWHYFYPFHWEERLKAHQWRAANAEQRQRLLESHADRFADGRWPFAVHLWGVEDSSQRGIANVEDYGPAVPAGASDGTLETQAEDRQLAAGPAPPAMAGDVAERGRGGRETGRASRVPARLRR